MKNPGVSIKMELLNGSVEAVLGFPVAAEVPHFEVHLYQGSSNLMGIIHLQEHFTNIQHGQRAGFIFVLDPVQLTLKAKLTGALRFTVYSTASPPLLERINTAKQAARYVWSRARLRQTL
jgi:hypothetical protein